MSAWWRPTPLALRAATGPVAVFDPQGLGGDHLPRLRWAPQHGCTDPLLGIARARALAAGAKLDGGGFSDGTFRQQMTEAVLCCHLRAAAVTGVMRYVLGWVARPADPARPGSCAPTRTRAPGWAEELTAQAGADPPPTRPGPGRRRRALDALADPWVLDACPHRWRGLYLALPGWFGRFASTSGVDRSTRRPVVSSSV